MLEVLRLTCVLELAGRQRWNWRRVLMIIWHLLRLRNRTTELVDCRATTYRASRFKPVDPGVVTVNIQWNPPFSMQSW